MKECACGVHRGRLSGCGGGVRFVETHAHRERERREEHGGPAATEASSTRLLSRRFHSAAQSIDSSLRDGQGRVKLR